MGETTAPDVHIPMPKAAPPAASSLNAVEPPLQNESGGTGAASAPHLMFIKDVSSPGQVAANLKPKGGNSNFDFELRRKRVADLVREGVAAAKWTLCILLLLLLFMVIVVFVPGLKRIKVLGLPLWIWMVVPALYIVSYRYISLLGECTVKKLSLTMREDKYALVYYLDGLGGSGYNLIVCVVILLAWELYFRSPRHGLRRYRVSEKALDIGTWTAVSLLVGAFLVLVKNALILSWESRAIYSRFAGNIRKVGLQLYFLGLVHDLDVDIFSPDKGIPEKADNINNSDTDEGILEKADNINNSDTDEENSDADEENSEAEGLSTYRKKHMAQCFIEVTKLCSRNYDPIPNKIRKQWQKFKEDGSNYIIEESVRKKLQDHKISVNNMVINGWFKELRDADILENNSNSSSTDAISYSTFEGWMMEAFKNCLSFGYTLTDAKSATDTLNNIMWAFIVIVVILCWLLLTGIASVKVLIAMASPLLAASFIFGDTLKAIFEGIIFTFVLHPFLVGNWCEIDDTQLEVKQINVLKTTFHKIDNKDEVLYPNKVLAEKRIIKLKRDLVDKDLDGRDINLRMHLVGMAMPAKIKDLGDEIQDSEDEYELDQARPNTEIEWLPNSVISVEVDDSKAK
ncbi:hypothetical protein Nepgr_023867 [Nepenthes gracilis]|uniref:Mechanosensitive ion channel MscS domain-containing protein n=1 Tax=Nepenthes gracilis TaxID=150966 RepID=A0AAD3T3U2_NEPGR|nr:hypothetical protein Nepgr_023867 [Nepenthes gracilis]